MLLAIHTLAYSRHFITSVVIVHLVENKIRRERERGRGERKLIIYNIYKVNRKLYIYSAHIHTEKRYK